MNRCISLLVILLSSGVVFAQDDITPIFTLETIEVSATAIDMTGTGNRVGLEPLDSPDSSTVIDDEIIDEQQANRLDDILKNDASISNKGNFGAQSSFTSRGFTLSDSGNYLRNGLQYFYFDAPPVESIDRVEILKGPASFLYGSGSPGGMINFITKMPQQEDFNHAGAQTGSWDYYRAYADVNHHTESVDARLNLAIEDTKSFRDHYFHERELFDFSAKGQTLPQTSTLFNFTYQHTNQPQDTGLVAVGDEVVDLPRSTYLNQDWTKTELDSIITSLDSYTDLVNDWTLHSALYYQYVDRERILSSLRMRDDDSTDFQYSMQRRLDIWHNYTALFEVLANKEFLGFDQKLLFGVTDNLTAHKSQETKTILSDVYSIYDPPTLPEPDLGDFQDPVQITTNNVGVYAQDVIQLHTQWEMIMGARYDTYQAYSSTVEDGHAQHISPHLALLYKPLYNWSQYISYTEGFEFNEAVSDRNAVNFGESLDPTLSEQIELGTKLELFDSKLLLSAAIFDILRTNQPVTEDFEGDEGGEVIVVQRGEQHHQGLELGAQGHISDAFTLLSTLMWMDAELTDGNPAEIEGNQPAAVAKIAATLWGEYRFQEGALNDFAINSGAFYEGERYGDDENTFVLDPYTRIDAGVAYYYPIKKNELAIRLTVENITDVDYFYAYRRTNVTVGSPRSVWLTFEIE